MNSFKKEFKPITYYNIIARVFRMAKEGGGSLFQTQRIFNPFVRELFYGIKCITRHGIGPTMG